jgi:hypothetical protein
MGLLARLLGLQPTEPKPCRVEILHVTVSPPDYFAARCDGCDWVGQCFETAGPAFDEARKHCGDVEPEIVEI